jgi:hypothetical protein
MNGFHDQLALLDDIPHEDVLFFVACSDRKLETDTPVPLRDLYDGPVWQTLRSHGSHVRDSQIVVLSGKYGWTGAGAFHLPYNERISPQKVDRLVERGATVQDRTSKGMVIGWTPVQLVARPFGAEPWTAVVVCAGELYRRAIDPVVRELKDLGYIDAGAPELVMSGGIGDQRGQLGQVLRHLDPDLRFADAPGPR